MILIDANVILRYLLGDNPEMCRIASEAIASGSAFTLPAVLAEVVYVLNKHYEVPRGEIRDLLTRLLDRVSIDHPEVLVSALSYYADRNMDFVDGILISRARLLGETVLTFDKKLRKMIEQ